MRLSAFPFHEVYRWNRITFLFTVLLLTHAAIAQQATQVPTRGKRFWTGFMQNGFGAQGIKLHILGTNATSGTVSMPLTGWSVPFSVSTNGVAVIDVPTSAENTGSGTVANKGILIQASVGPDSTTCPAYITSTRSQKVETSRRSWLMKM